VCTAVTIESLWALPDDAADDLAQVNDSAGVVMWLWHRLGNQPPDIALPCMLELLTVLPEVRTKSTCGLNRVRIHHAWSIRK
jgi:hypothetical protein